MTFPFVKPRVLEYQLAKSSNPANVKHHFVELPSVLLNATNLANHIAFLKLTITNRPNLRIFKRMS